MATLLFIFMQKATGCSEEMQGSNLTMLTEQIAKCLQQHQLKLTTAESCTGGWIAQECTALAGSSNWFERGFVTYSNEAKQEMLSVNAKTLEQFGAVSAQTAIEMAQGALTHSHAEVAVSVTGIAGPSGGSDDKPIGLVHFAWAQLGKSCCTTKQNFSGDREAIRRQSVAFALSGLLDFINGN